MVKKSSITKSDFIEFAEDFVDDAESKIQKVQDAISAFGTFDGTNYTVAADFLTSNVTINIRKNGNEEEYKAEDCIWKACQKAYSFKNEDDVNEYLPMSDNSVSILSSTSTKESLVIPASVTNGGKTYSVGMISDYAFEDVKSNVKEIILRGPVEYVGSCAFYSKASGTSSIENIFFTDYQNVGTNELSTSRFGLDDEYKEFLSTQKIYVAKSKESNYKTSWTNFADQISYQIPFPNNKAVSTRYGTFSREFDVDLQDEVDGVAKNPMTASGKPAVVAYTGFVKKYQANDNTYIRMQSINCGGEGDGTYIPANTGVLLEANDKKEVTGSESSPEGFYYRIGEGNNGTSTLSDGTENVMQCVTETSRTITGKEGDYYNFVISGGKYWSLGDTKSVTIPAHKSYLHIPASSVSQSKQLVLVFEDDDTTTDILSIDKSVNSENVIYDLLGRRVQSISKSGMYIINGKKTIR